MPFKTSTTLMAVVFAWTFWLGSIACAFTAAQYDRQKIYKAPNGLPVVMFKGTTSEELQRLIDKYKRSKSPGVMIKVPKANYKWGEVKLRSNVHLVIQKGAVITPKNAKVRRIFSVGLAGNGERLSNVSITGGGGPFGIDLSAKENLNADVAAIKAGRVSNFEFSGFFIKDRRTSLANILISYVKSKKDPEPWPKNGVIQNIKGVGISHTGYGLVQVYSATNLLFRNLYCNGGVTLRLETDDRQMKSAVKEGNKACGIDNLIAENIQCTSGQCALMLSPHFVPNQRVVASNIHAIGCAFAVRVEPGFLEVFDADNEFPLTPQGGKSFRKHLAAMFKNVDATQMFIGQEYRRNNGKQWAIRVAGEAIASTNSQYILKQLGSLRPGKFESVTVTNVAATYKPTNAKAKQSFLRFLKCPYINENFRRPTDTKMGNGFELYGPSIGLVYNIADKNGVSGNYNVTVTGNEKAVGFPANTLTNVSSADGTPILCQNPGVGKLRTTKTPELASSKSRTK